MVVTTFLPSAKFVGDNLWGVEKPSFSTREMTTNQLVDNLRNANCSEPITVYVENEQERTQLIAYLQRLGLEELHASVNFGRPSLQEMKNGVTVVILPCCSKRSAFIYYCRELTCA